MNSILKHPIVYEYFQILTGFSDVRRKAFEEYLAIKSGCRILDVGCGPGRILTYLPDDIDYTGFDVDKGYIDSANRHYGHRARFHCRLFDQSVLQEHQDVDIVMLNGVLHHLSDEEIHGILSVARRTLAPGGVVFTLDGCYRPGQNPIARKLLDMDRGKHVRTEEAYRALVEPHFPSSVGHLREDMSFIPYTFLIFLLSGGDGGDKGGIQG